MAKLARHSMQFISLLGRIKNRGLHVSWITLRRHDYLGSGIITRRLPLKTARGRGNGNSKDPDAVPL